MIPALLHPRAALFVGRAEDAGKLIPAVDLVLTDPPYGAHTHANLGKERRSDGTAARPLLDFPPLTRDQVRFYSAEWVRMSRGWIIIFTDDRSVSWWGEEIEQAGGRWLRTGHWVKTNPMPQMTGDRPSVGTEPIVIAHCGKVRPAWRGGGRAAVWRGPRDRDGLHPNQKPLWLMQELAGLFAEPGAVVLDPFLGSGSTAIGALSAGRYPGSQTLLNVKRRKNEPPAEVPETAPMPQGFSFVGVDGNAEHVGTAIRRLAEIGVAPGA